MEDKQKFLHGTLEATIFDATPYNPPFPLNCLLVNGKATFVTIELDNKNVAETTHEHDRVWNQTFQILCAHPYDSIITITMKTKCSVLGRYHVQAQQILSEATLINGFFPLVMENGKQNPELLLRFMLWFKPAELEPTWGKIFRNGGFPGLRNATFPQRSDCGVVLYQDAHHSSAFQPPFCLTPRKLWEDVYKAIEGAKHLIYIAGWSFNPKMVLVRDPETVMPHARGVKLGELLKRKAEEGVAVRIMLWDDETSLPFIKNKGVMGTHDEDSFAYFKHTKVICKLCPRLHFNFPTVFTHHQKTITIDTRVNISSTDRELMSFVGGLDLYDGRYDTEQHSLFHTLNTESHRLDFYQTSIAGASLQKGGPREPWHDAHACVTGEAAWDILTNFEQRWTKQCDPSLLVPTSTISNLIHSPFPTSISNDRNWKVQVFRSIDHVSATQLSKNLTVERSVHEAYVEAIRRAERFIYIENQYFIGGCHLWDKDRHSGCRNLIPIEIALKIASKIRAKQRFAAYILIPMWPEGVPDSEPVQDILHWTRETMTMMYKLIAEAIKKSGGNGHPRDYLNFFCLANRETERKEEFVPSISLHPSTPYWNVQKHRRFMVYVHSKLMIVDDAYILIGSANVNQRSMDGQRDTEIAIGCHQPLNGERDNSSTGYIHSYRMSLWYEHTGVAENIYKEPESLECVQRMRMIGDEMWEIYSGEQIVDMEGVHLVTYPVDVTEDGVIGELVNSDGNFPDTKSPVKGRRSKVLPPLFTT
ncbi:hypothetical protein SLEP1_g44655 [Rubroshorea leprosula]|uniref:Phospholipase D n=1 Tax=Rubroshorea leprosula TaxID=152421 RepID=A0AAV5LI18_9ROSI|nr:hypothetical protein SLEP1_g44655 [Rubroshorea leprosula]